MKKLLSTFFVLIGIITLSTINPVAVAYTEEVDLEYLDIYYLNDFHGAITPGENNIGLAYISNLIITEKEANPENVVVLAGGDILQGSALSNYYFGESTINMLNEMYFDAFTVGNHEFDWGLDIIQGYRDADLTNGEADFPMLGANIREESTNEIPENIDPYVIIERGNLKIGIIGTMGFGLESSIATSKISGFEFISPVPVVKEITADLRNNQDVDLVFVLAHDSGAINSELSSLTGEYKVDAIFNGHSHSAYAQSESGIPIIQSGSTGRYVGYIRLNLSAGTVTNFTVDNLSASDNILLETPNDAVQDLIEYYQAETTALFDTPIITNGQDLSQMELTYWIAELMRLNTGADIAFHNNGGTRASIYDDEVINLAKLYEVWPFDNYIMTVNLYGSQINTLMSGGDSYSSSLEEFEAGKLYKVATNDYIFDKPSNPYLAGDNPQNTYLFFRDIAATEMTLQSLVYDDFKLTNEFQFVYVDEVVDETPNLDNNNDGIDGFKIVIYSVIGISVLAGGAILIKKSL